MPNALRSFLDRTEITLSLSTDSKRTAYQRSITVFLRIEELRETYSAYQRVEITEDYCQLRKDSLIGLLRSKRGSVEGLKRPAE